MIKFDLIITDEEFINEINRLNKNRINKISTIKKCYLQKSGGINSKIFIEDEYNYNRKDFKYRLLCEGENYNFEELINKVHVFSDNDIQYGVLNYIFKNFNFDCSLFALVINNIRVNSFRIQNIEYCKDKIKITNAKKEDGALFSDVMDAIYKRIFISFAEQLQTYINNSDEFVLMKDDILSSNYYVYVMNIKTKKVERYVFVYSVYDGRYNLLIDNTLSKVVSMPKKSIQSLSERISKQRHIAKLDDEHICYFAKPVFFYKDKDAK